MARWRWVAALAVLGATVGWAGADLGDLRQRAQAGDPRAQNQLGEAYLEGKRVARNEAEAVVWFRRAAEKGHAEAQYNLSVCYANGQGVRQDDGETAKWTRLAAEQGIAGAQYGLGLLYAVGAGLPQDPVEAYLWFTLAARGLAGDDRAMAEEDRALVAAKMPPAQVAKAESRAAAWRPR